MKKLIPYSIFIFISASAARNYLPVQAGGCSSHSNKSGKLKCDKDDTECQKKKIKNFDINNSINS